jgi:hypothetical protein
VEANYEVLATVLERHRDVLQALPGVVGSGLGQDRSLDLMGGYVIQVFVQSAPHVGPVTRAAGAILEGLPLEVLVTGEVTSARP